MADLVLYQSAKEALAECKFTDEVKDWVDRAAATQAYARMAKDKGLEVDAAEIRIRAERRLGEMLAEQKVSGGMSTGAKGIGKSVVPTENRTPTLAEVGIDKKLSARAQKTAAIPEPEFEGIVEEWRDRVSQEGERVTAKLEAAGKRAKPDKSDEPEEPEVDDRLGDLVVEYEALTRIVEADDKLAAAWAEVKLEQERHAQTKRLYEAQRGELAEMTREAKRWMRKAQALEKAAKS
jgi:hypothetical protein